jgi:hypothetical protein
MKLTTITIPAIEMTQKEEDELYWHMPYQQRFVCGKKVIRWNTDDGNNLMLLEGETVYRQVVIKRTDEA